MVETCRVCREAACTCDQVKPITKLHIGDTVRVGGKDMTILAVNGKGKQRDSIALSDGEKIRFITRNARVILVEEFGKEPFYRLTL